MLFWKNSQQVPVVSRMSTRDLFSFTRSMTHAPTGICVNFSRICHAVVVWTSS